MRTRRPGPEPESFDTTDPSRLDPADAAAVGAPVGPSLAAGPAGLGGRSFGRSPAWWRGLREIVLIVGLWLGYSLGRNLADKDPSRARARGLDIYHFEQFLHIDAEHWLNHATIGITWLSVTMCFWYAALHYTITPAVLAFVYIRRSHDYARIRNALVLASLVALIVYIFWPVAPPRLIGSPEWRDTLGRYASYGWWTDHASAPAGMQQLTNEYAAMPSLHVGWTVWVAWVARRHGNRFVQALSIFYVVGTAMVVFCTANHWILDVVAGISLVLAAIWTVNHVEPLRHDDGFLRLVHGLRRRRTGNGSVTGP